MRYWTEVFQDIDGYYSFKRLAVAVVIVLLATVIYAPFFGINFPDLVMTTLADMFKWGVGLIATEQVVKFAPGKKEE